MSSTFDLDAALTTLGRGGPLLICPHDDPDPDSLAAAWGMAVLLERELGRATTIAFAGIIGRAENRAMVRELSIKLRRLDSLATEEFDGAVLVDTQPPARNHSVPAGLPVVICVDHHRSLAADADPPWHDVRPDGGTTSSMVLGYLRERGIEPDGMLATAILYALKTDTRDLSRDVAPADVEAWQQVFPRADARALGAIVAPRLERRYFHELHHALDRACIRGNTVEVFVDDLPYPDLVAEFADLFVRRRGIDWCLCGGVFDGQLRFSLRTEDPDANAGAVALRLAAIGGGSAGGHGMTAGGRIRLDDDDDVKHAQLWAALVDELLTRIGADEAAELEPLCPDRP